MKGDERETVLDRESSGRWGRENEISGPIKGEAYQLKHLILGRELVL